MTLGRFFGFLLPADPTDGRITALEKQLADVTADRDRILDQSARHLQRALAAEDLAAERLAEIERLRGGDAR